MKYPILFVLFLLITVSLSAKKDIQPQWISASDTQEINVKQPHFFYYRKTFKLKKPPHQFLLKIISMNQYKVWINGVPVIKDAKNSVQNNAYLMDTLWLKKYLIKGMNSIAIKTRLMPTDGEAVREGIFFQLHKQDSLNIVSDNSWICGLDDALKIQTKPAYTIDYDAGTDVFSGFYEYRYTEKVRGKDKWKPVYIMEDQPKIQDGYGVVKRLKMERTHQYTGIALPKFLKQTMDIDWDIKFSSPVYFGFKIESIGSKAITLLLETEEYGLLELNYLTKEGGQEFILDIPLTIKNASIHLPVYMKINNIFFKEIKN